MTSFITQTTKPLTATVADPTKHVRYVRGMVLGEDDLMQEFAYHNGMDQRIIRELIGYGTACGLKVSLSYDGKTTVQVDAGVAVNPRGQLISVPETQCAILDDWLSKPTQQVTLKTNFGTAPNAKVPVYVVLCYRECETNPVPLPGEPCRTEEDSMTDSRIQDSFQLELRFERPEQIEEDAVRDFVTWLSQIQLTTGNDFTSLENFVLALRNAPLSSPLNSPLSPLASPLSPLPSPLDFMLSTPPDWLKIDATQVELYLRTAFRIWVTELRPNWIAARNCADTPAESCVLLAEIDVSMVYDTVSSSWTVPNPLPDNSIIVDEEKRPYLLHLRMIQEWMLRTYKEGGTGAITLTGNASGPIGANIVTAINNINVVPSDIMLPGPGQVLTFEGGQWIAKDPQVGGGGGGPVNLAGDVTGAESTTVVEKIRGVKVSETVPDKPGQVLVYNDQIEKEWEPTVLDGDIAVTVPPPAGAPGIVTVTRIQHTKVAENPPTVDGQQLTFQGDQWTPITPTGDVKISTSPGHDLGSLTVTKIQGVPVADSTPSPDQVLTFQNGQWIAATPTVGGTPVNLTGEDVVGASDSTVVQGIAQIRIETPFKDGGTPFDGQSLRYDANKKLWVAADPTIIATGLLKGDGSSRFPTYNGLTVKGVTDGRMFITFDSYSKFDEHPYIVKALPVLDTSELLVHIQFGSFNADTFTLIFFGINVSNGELKSAPMDTESLKRFEVMVEVTRYLDK